MTAAMSFTDKLTLWSLFAVVAVGVVWLGVSHFRHRATLSDAGREREDEETADDTFFW